MPWPLQLLDVKNALVHGDFSEEVYVIQTLVLKFAGSENSVQIEERAVLVETVPSSLV